MNKIPEILSYTKQLIDKYFHIKNDCLPERFERVNWEQVGLQSDYDLTIKKIVQTLKQDVCYRFPKVADGSLDVYGLDKKIGTITLKKANVHLLAEYSDLLFQVINYRWTQMLESFNHSPRISMKVRAIDEGKIRRSNLSSYHKYLDIEFSDNDRYCFHCGEAIGDGDLSVDHVIPWSFMFSDDLWNLVYCHKSENSSKSNSSPTVEMICKLEQRNKVLLDRFENATFSRDKKYDELKLAIEKDYVRKFWLAAKG